MALGFTKLKYARGAAIADRWDSKPRFIMSRGSAGESPAMLEKATSTTKENVKDEMTPGALPAGAIFGEGG